MSHLFQPLTVGGLTLKNRLVFAPTSLGKGAIETYKALAQGDVGLIILPDLSAAPSILGAPSLDTTAFAPYFQEIIQLCHEQGCMVGAQLFYPEYDPAYVAGLFRSRTAGADARRLLAENTLEFCDKLTTAQIEDILQALGAAAANAAALGFDLIQLHGDRLLGSFSSPLFNHRTDRFGYRPTFAAEALRAVRAAAPGLALDYKLTIRTATPPLGKGGILPEDAAEFVLLLEQAGADSFHVTLANHSSLEDTIPAQNHPFLQGEGCFLPLARAVRQCSSKPVCAVGKLQHPAFVEGLLEEGFAMVGLSRQLIADPLWGRKILEGHPEEIVYCRYCNLACANALRSGKPVGCVLRQPTAL